LLPTGIAALSAFIVGWVGAILCMDQTYFVGPMARLVGDYGADVSFECFETEEETVKMLTFDRSDYRLRRLGRRFRIHL
jgi:hypothetical protein